MNSEKNTRPSLETTTPFGGFGARFLHNLSSKFSAEKIRRTVRRFPLTIVGILTLAGFLLVQIHSRKSDYVDERVWYFLPLAILLSMAFYLAAETRLCRWFRNLLNALLIGCWAWFSFTLSKPIAEAEIIRLALLAVSFGLTVFFAAHVTDKRPMKFWDDTRETFFQLVMAYFFAGVLMAGLSLALLSLDKLFGVNIPDRYYGYLATLCFVAFAPLYFLPSVPKRKVEGEDIIVETTVFVRIFGLYILLPILGIYTLILYGYLGKIIVTWQLPNGWVSWLVSVLGVAGYLTMFIISPILHPNPLNGEQDAPLSETGQLDSHTKTPPLGGWGARLGGRGWFFRFFPIILLPLLVLMFAGIMRRFSDYGITINRLLVLLLNGWMFGVSIYLIISKTKPLKWVFVSFAAIALLSAVGPWNVMSVTKRSLTNELTQLLTETKWSSIQKKEDIKNQIVPLDSAKQERLYDIINYLSRNYGKESIRPFYTDKLGDKATQTDFINALGVNKEWKEDKYFSIYNNEQNYEMDINGYTTFLSLSKPYQNNEFEINENFSAKTENSQVKITDKKTKSLLIIPLDSIIKSAINQSNQISTKEASIIGNNYKLIINNLDGEREIDNKIKINSFNGILLLK